MILKDGPLLRFSGRLCGHSERQIQSRDPDFFETCVSQKRTISSFTDDAMVILQPLSTSFAQKALDLQGEKCSAERLQSTQLRSYCEFRTRN
jgi:hypothetical protein